MDFDLRHELERGEEGAPCLTYLLFSSFLLQRGLGDDLRCVNLIGLYVSELIALGKSSLEELGEGMACVPFPGTGL